MNPWQPARAEDVDAADALAARIHRDYPEGPAVFRSRLALYPEGFLVLRDPEVFGYAIFHPWTFGAPPRLNQRLDALPAEPDCLHLHDIAIDARGRAQGYAAQLLPLLGPGRLTLVAVGGTEPFWQSFGFVPLDLASAREACLSYGRTSVYMVRGGLAA